MTSSFISTHTDDTTSHTNNKARARTRIAERLGGRGSQTHPHLAVIAHKGDAVARVARAGAKVARLDSHGSRLCVHARRTRNRRNNRVVCTKKVGTTDTHSPKLYDTHTSHVSPCFRIVGTTHGRVPAAPTIKVLCHTAVAACVLFRRYG